MSDQRKTGAGRGGPGLGRHGATGGSGGSCRRGSRWEKGMSYWCSLGVWATARAGGGRGSGAGELCAEKSSRSGLLSSGRQARSLTEERVKSVSCVSFVSRLPESGPETLLSDGAGRRAGRTYSWLLGCRPGRAPCAAEAGRRAALRRGRPRGRRKGRSGERSQQGGARWLQRTVR